MNEFSIKLMGEAKPKKRPRVVRHGAKIITYTPKNEETAYYYWQLLKAVKPILFVDCPIRVIVEFHLKRPKTVKRDMPIVKPDIDNLEKELFDVCNGVLWKDDCQIIELHSKKVYSESLPFTLLRVEEASASIVAERHTPSFLL